MPLPEGMRRGTGSIRSRWEISMKQITTALAGATFALAAVLTVPALGDGDVSHNWNSENEAEAMRIFRDKFVELGGEWKDTAFPDTQASISSVKTRFIGGNPPMALQSALGGVMQEFGAAGMLQNMDEAAAAGGWADNISDSIAAVAKFDGHWVAAPAFVDVVNWLYTNNDVLAEAGVAEPGSWDEFKASLPVLQGSRQDTACRGRPGLAGRNPVRPRCAGGWWRISLRGDDERRRRCRFRSAHASGPGGTRRSAPIHG